MRLHLGGNFKSEVLKPTSTYFGNLSNKDKNFRLDVGKPVMNFLTRKVTGEQNKSPISISIPSIPKLPSIPSLPKLPMPVIPKVSIAIPEKKKIPTFKTPQYAKNYVSPYKQVVKKGGRRRTRKRRKTSRKRSSRRRH